MKIPWYYVWSQRYAALHYALEDAINKSDHFQAKGVFVDQSEFNKTTYREGFGHFMCGCFIKHENLLKILKEVPLYSYIIFSDVDNVLLNHKGLFEYFETIMDRGVDMVYMWEKADPRKSVNIGFSLLRASPKVIQFYENVMKNSINSFKADGDLVDELLHDFPGSLETFDPHYCILSNYIEETQPKTNIKVIQVLCSNDSNFSINMLQKYKGAKYLGIPIEKYIMKAIESGIHPDVLGVKLA